MSMQHPLPDAKADVRRRVIDAAMKAFAEKGIRSVTMDDVAHILSMSKRTLYQLFADKQDLLLACVKRKDEERDAMLQQLVQTTENVLEVLLVVFEFRMHDMDQVHPSFFADLVKYPKVLHYFDEKRRMHEEEAVAFLEKGVEQGFFRSDLNVRIIYYCASSSISSLLQRDAFQHCRPHEIFLNTSIVYLRGCATEKGIAMIDAFLQAHNDEQVAL
ncbi:MAG: TetR/AcrR family transcriptional regulator [Prevotellamassilia sp.]|nr:TetR/AcrR family transcriptional regulator [Prevotellamassilia sp.]